MAAAMPEPAMPCTSLRAESFGKLLRPETPGPGAADAVALETTRTRSPSYSFAKSARDNYKPSEFAALNPRDRLWPLQAECTWSSTICMSSSSTLDVAAAGKLRGARV
jgi:hypothetical protein